MKVSQITVKNYRGLKDIKIPVSNFTCIIGENNVGKSSLLQAFILFVKGTRLSINDFYNPEEPIFIRVDFEEISEEDLASLADEHKNKVQSWIENNRLALCRKYDPEDFSSSLRIVKKVPRDPRFDIDEINDLIKGKSGKDLKETFTANFPEIDITEKNITTQKAVKQTIEEYISKLPESELEERDTALETGIDNSIKALLPEPIYIPAVKELSDDVKTKESATFGKLLSLLLSVVEPEVTNLNEVFATLDKQLNKSTSASGVTSDERLDQIKAIENTVEKYIQETFKKVSLDIVIPPPDLKTIFSSAAIIADDGVKGPVDFKGDGLKRSITFAILRTFAEFSKKPEWQNVKTKKTTQSDRYLFLFEEPELFLHPKSQKIFFDALSQISNEYQVVVSTHSPIFFNSESTQTFVKMYKESPQPTNNKPYGMANHISLLNVSTKDQFQLISYETNNAAFFADGVVLVEGDSDLIMYPHIAKTINPNWDFKKESLEIVQIRGKGSIKRYKEYFNHFGIKVYVITDCDTIVKGFPKVDPTEELKKIHSDLMQKIDSIAKVDTEKGKMTWKKAKEELLRGDQKSLYIKMTEVYEKYLTGNSSIEEVKETIKEFYKYELKDLRLSTLKNSNDKGLLDLKYKLLQKLRENNIFILDKGAIEDYYPDGISGNDKPSMAQEFCKKITSREDLLKLCKNFTVGEKQKPEFELIFENIFGHQ